MKIICPHLRLSGWSGRPFIRHLIFCLAVFLLPREVSAQSWRTVAPNDTVYFQAGEFQEGPPYYPAPLATPLRRLRVMWIDSVRSGGSDTIYSFFRTLRMPDSVYHPSYQVSGCIDTNAPGWLGPAMIRSADGKEQYVNKKSDTIEVLTHGAVGAAWTFWKDTAHQEYRATVTSVDTQAIDGELDSVKTIRLDFLLNGSPANGDFGGRALRISKAHGWVETLDLYAFPYVKDPDNLQSFADQDSAMHSRVPKLISHHPTKTDTSFYRPGNRFVRYTEEQPTYYSPKLIEYYGDSIKFLTPQGNGSYSVEAHSEFYRQVQDATGHPVHDESDSYPRSFLIDTNQIVTPSFIELKAFPEYFGGDTSLYANGPLSTKLYAVGSFCGHALYHQSRSSGPGKGEYQGCFRRLPFFETGEGSDSSFLAGYGWINKNSSSFDADHGEINIHRNIVIYMKLGACVSGPGIAIPTAVKQDSYRPSALRCYPNPASQILHISVDERKTGTVALRELSGRTLLLAELKEGGCDLNVAGLAEGIYFLEVCYEGKSAFEKVLVSRP